MSGLPISFPSRPLPLVGTLNVRRGGHATLAASSLSHGPRPRRSLARDHSGRCLGNEGHEVLKTFEAGDTTVGAMIRQIVLDPATGEMSPRAEALLYAADK